MTYEANTSPESYHETGGEFEVERFHDQTEGALKAAGGEDLRETLRQPETKRARMAAAAVFASCLASGCASSPSSQFESSGVARTAADSVSHVVTPENVSKQILSKSTPIALAMEAMKVPEALQYRTDVKNAIKDLDKALEQGGGEFTHEADDVRASFSVEKANEEDQKKYEDDFPDGVPERFDQTEHSKVLKTMKFMGKILDIIPRESFLGKELREKQDAFLDSYAYGIIQDESGNWYYLIETGDLEPRSSYKGTVWEGE